MADDREDRIRRRAHELWEAEGKPNGRDRLHWDQAVQEMTGQQDNDPAELAAEESIEVVEAAKTATARKRKTLAEAAPPPD